ncbi:MAG: ferrous iron transport protein A [Syntrophobacteraceae bacterium]
MFGGWKCRERHGCCHGHSEDGLHSVPLCEAVPGKRVKVMRIVGGRQVCARMAAMGIYPGAEVELLPQSCGAPCLVRVHGGTLSLGAGLTRDIMVSPSI